MTDTTSPSPADYDPSQYNVSDVEAFLKANPDQAQRILDAETNTAAGGKDRTTVKDAANAILAGGDQGSTDVGDNTAPATDQSAVDGANATTSTTAGGNDVRTAGGESVTPGTVAGTQDVRRSDDAALADVRTGVVADNQPTPQVWDAAKGEMVDHPEMKADADTSGDGAADNQ